MPDADEFDADQFLGSIASAAYGDLDRRIRVACREVFNEAGKRARYANPETYADAAANAVVDWAFAQQQERR